MARKVTKTEIRDGDGNFLFTQTVTSYTDDEEPETGYHSWTPEERGEYDAMYDR